LSSGNLLYLNLSRNHIHTIESEAFRITTKLITLDLSYNNILQIYPGTFLPLGSLKELYLQGNPFRVAEGMFDGLFNLHTLHVSFYTICCATPNSIYDIQCIAPPTEISSCENLIAVPVLNVAIWYLALLSLFGNIIVLVYNTYKLKDKTSAYYVLTINLGCADFLMGVYLFIIAITNLYYSGRYGLSDYYWRHSIGCTIAGIIGTLSSEASAFTVFLITLDRFIVVKYPFSNMKLTAKSAFILCLICWLVGIIMSVIPLFPGIGLDDFYAQSGVCISLPLSVIRKPGWEYSMIIFVGLNFFLFLGIFVGQISIFLSVVSVGRNVDSAKRKEREASLATTLFAIVVTDVCCWIPIGTIGKTFCIYKHSQSFKRRMHFAN
jgi:leucine-rich repeat-containing G protein-coupled receptor 7